MDTRASQLGTGSYAGYGIGDMGFNLVFQFTQIYLSYVFAKIFGLSGGQAASIFLIARLWDAINDPIMGALAARTRSRWGTYRPYLLLSILPLAGSLCMLFYKPDLSDTGIYIYALVAYILFGMAFTLGNVPYGALTASLTQDYTERSKLTSWRMTSGIIGGIIAVGLARPLAGIFTETTGSKEMGWFYTAVCMAVFMSVALLATFVSVQEPIQEAPAKSTSFSFMESWRTLKGNRPFWFLTAAFVCNFIALTLITGSVPFFFEAYMRDTMLEAPVTGLVFITAAISVPIWAWLARKSSKRTVYQAGLVVYILGLVSVYFLAQKGMTTLYTSFFLVGLGAGASAYAGWAMLPDTVEFGEWKNGSRNEGAVYGIYGFFFKLGIGLGLVLLNLGLDFVGYSADQLAQTAAARQGIRTIASIGPMVFLLLSGLLIIFYNLGPKSHAFIVNELAKRKGSQQVNLVGEEVP